MKVMNRVEMEPNMTPFQKKISGQIKLPSLGKNIHVLMQAVADDTLTYRQLAGVIKQYPEITARLIFLVNSPWSAPIKPISNIEDACARLGTSVVKSISIAISIASSFDAGKCVGFITEHFWTSSMLVSDGAYLLASKMPKGLGGSELEQTVQTAGILHNLGLLWLVENLSKETSQAFEKVAAESSLTVSQALLEFAGADYCEVGGWVGEQLKLPEVLVIAMKHHLAIDYQNASWEVALLVGSAANMVAALRRHSDELPENARLETLGLDTSIQRQVFQQLGNKFDKTQELAKILFGRR